MKKVKFISLKSFCVSLFLFSFLLISCGPSAEEKEALKNQNHPINSEIFKSTLAVTKMKTIKNFNIIPTGIPLFAESYSNPVVNSYKYLEIINGKLEQFERQNKVEIIFYWIEGIYSTEIGGSLLYLMTISEPLNNPAMDSLNLILKKQNEKIDALININKKLNKKFTKFMSNYEKKNL